MNLNTLEKPEDILPLDRGYNYSPLKENVNHHGKLFYC